jgi:DNA-binding MarR family transcriptional regulator
MEDEIRLVELFHQISRKLWKLLAQFFKKEGLSITEIIVIATMRKKLKCHATELATLIGIPTSTLTGILDRLVEQGFLQRAPDPVDRRSILITATEKLNTFFKNLMTPMGNILKNAFRSIPDVQMNRLVTDLQVVLESLEHLDPSGECREK